MSVSPDIQIICAMQLNDAKTPFGGKMVFFDNHIAVNFNSISSFICAI